MKCDECGEDMNLLMEADQADVWECPKGHRKTVPLDGR